jgi:hypothetical protein
MVVKPRTIGNSKLWWCSILREVQFIVTASLTDMRNTKLSSKFKQRLSTFEWPNNGTQGKIISDRSQRDLPCYNVHVLQYWNEVKKVRKKRIWKKSKYILPPWLNDVWWPSYIVGSARASNIFAHLLLRTRSLNERTVPLVYCSSRFLQWAAGAESLFMETSLR